MGGKQSEVVSIVSLICRQPSCNILLEGMWRVSDHYWDGPNILPFSVGVKNDVQEVRNRGFSW